jgi:uncharacterized protein (DUF2147 family)
MKNYRRVLLGTFAVLIMNLTINAKSNEGEIVGKWETEKKDAKMEVFKSGNTYSAKLLWGEQIVEADGVTSIKDVNNPDKSLRDRNVVGIVYITKLKYDDGEYVDGRVYSAQRGATYDCKVWIEDGNLHLRGYVGISLFGQTTVWKRIND